LTKFDSRRSGTQRARELSRTAEEKIEVGQLQSTWQKRINEAIAERDTEFREVVALATVALKPQTWL